MADPNLPPDIIYDDDPPAFAPGETRWDDSSPEYDSDSEDGGMQIEPQVISLLHANAEAFAYSPHSPLEPRDGKIQPAAQPSSHGLERN